MSTPWLPLKAVAALRVSNVDKHSLDGEVPVRLANYVDVYYNDVLGPDLPYMSATATPEEISRFALNGGETLITKDSESPEDIAVPAYVSDDIGEVVCAYHIAILEPRKDLVDPKFLFWSVKSRPVAEQFSVAATGVTRFGLRQDAMRAVRIPCPSLDNQRAIADYLDRETAQIDTLIAKQEALIETLLERRSGVAEHVLGGYVGSGERLKWSFSEVDDRARERANDLPLLSVSISWGVKRRDDVTINQAASESLSSYKVARRGHVVLNRMRAFQGALGVAPEDGVVSPDYAVLSIVDDVSSEWLAETMRTPVFVAEMVKRLKGIGSADLGAVRTPRINVADLGEIRVAIPSAAEQAATLERIANASEKIDALIKQARRFIELARERRAALITGAVTGQIDVREQVA